VSLILGIDPGLTGGIALHCSTNGLVWVKPMPTMEKARVGKKPLDVLDEAGLLALMQSVARYQMPNALYLEQVGGIPGQSAPAAFNFGHGYGAIRMAAMTLNIPIEPVVSSKWKPAMRAPKDKKGARFRASELFPAHAHLWPRVKDDGLAEAAMIAAYGARQQLQGL